MLLDPARKTGFGLQVGMEAGGGNERLTLMEPAMDRGRKVIHLTLALFMLAVGVGGQSYNLAVTMLRGAELRQGRSGGGYLPTDSAVLAGHVPQKAAGLILYFGGNQRSEQRLVC